MDNIDLVNSDKSILFTADGIHIPKYRTYKDRRVSIVTKLAHSWLKILGKE